MDGQLLPASDRTLSQRLSCSAHEGLGQRGQEDSPCGESTRVPASALDASLLEGLNCMGLTRNHIAPTLVRDDRFGFSTASLQRLVAKGTVA